MFYRHIFISENVNRERYQARPAMGGAARIPVRDRATQSQKLLSQFGEIWQQKVQLQQQRSAEQIATREGTYIQFTGAAGYDLMTKSLEDTKGRRPEKWIRLLNVKTEKNASDQEQTRATVYIPKGKEGYFIKKIEEYQHQNYRQSENPKNAKLVNSIEDIKIALIESLWTDNPDRIPTDTAKWCEAWLNVNTNENREQEQIQQFSATARNIGIEVKHRSIVFPERAVLLVNANRAQLVELMLQSDGLAEFRAGQEPAEFWVNEPRAEQQVWIEDLLQRIEVVESNVKVCLLDSGVNNGHQLLQPLMDDANTLAVDHAWGTNDHASGAGHGTLMAGIAGYGSMEQVLESKHTIPLTHKLCSVKMLPNQGETPRELWGDITSQGISIAEIQNPNMVLVYCMSVTSQEDTNRGRPSSWSGAVDNLAYGEGENQRLIIVSAGNVDEYESWQNYPDSNLVTSVQNPAQAWNALVAGAYTDKVLVNDPAFQNYTPVAGQGELSPHSSTSLVWEKKWAVKPDVVFEGGNLLKAPDHFIAGHKDLELLSTSKSFNTKPFDTVNATSAAAAQAAWFAAKIAYAYPDAWAETVRGLVVHSANWHPAMLTQLNKQLGDQSKRERFRNLLRTFGFGIPDLDRALYSRESALTYIAQETIQPFAFKEGGSTPQTNEIHFFNLPWASDLLLRMGEIPVTLKVTLSYFIEPGAGEMGWKDKYRYQSYGLRFDVNKTGENEEDFRKRVNIAAREEGEEVNTNADSGRWEIGPSNRSTGSIHSDYWEGTAADLSTCHHIAVFPVIGWWRERKHLGKVENQTRYSLIVSLETPAEDVQLYTTVKNMIEIPVEVLVT
jgi:hypothetical protein